MVYNVSTTNFDINRENILDLWRHNLNHTDEKRFEWLYEKNSLGNPRIFLIKDDRDNLVGMNGLLSRSFYVNGKIIEASQAIDLLVDRKHRTVGPAIQLHRELLGYVNANAIPFVYGFSLKSAALVLRRLGYGMLGSQERWVKPLKSKQLLERYFKFKPILVTISFIVDWGMKLFWHEAKLRKGKNTIISIDCEFDERFDGLWQRGFGQFFAVGERNSNYLHWRFSENPSKKFQVFSLSGRDGEMLGYVIYSTSTNGVVNIADLFYSDYKSLTELLREFVIQQKKVERSSINFSFLGPKKLKNILRKQGFIKRQEDSNILLYINANKNTIISDNLEAENWYITEADRDI